MKSEDALGCLGLYFTLDKIEGGRDFKGKVGNLKVGEKSKLVESKFLLGHPKQCSRKGSPINKSHFARFLSFCHL